VIAAWWLQAAVISTALALTAWALESAFATLGRPRRWAWVAAMIATVVLTIAGPFRSGPTIQLQSSNQVTLTTGDPSPLATATAWFSGLSVPNVNLPLVTLWAVVTATALAIGLFAYLRAVGRARLAPRATLHGAPVRLTTDDGPMIVGLRDPEIVVPRSLLLQDPDAVRLVLAHEREHLTARDPLLLLGAALIVAVLPGLPAIWWMRARLRLAVEIDCDGRVLARRRDRVEAYGDLLLALASRDVHLSPASLGLSLHPSSLERRIVAMTARPTRRWLPVLVLPVILGVMVACNAPLPTTEQEITPVLMLDGVEEEVAGVKVAGELIEYEIRPDQDLLEKVVYDEVPTRQALRLAPTMEIEGVKIVADSLIEIRVDASKRVPLLLKDVEVRRGQP
jgi:beta-lactamase regulating signal transducer with metallopeptidase domain